MTLVERAGAELLDVVGLEPAVGDQHQRLGRAVETEHAAEVDPRDTAHDLERPLGSESQIIAAASRHHDRVQRLQLPAPALVGRFAAGRPVPTLRRGHHRDPDRERQGRDQRGRPPEPEPPRLASELQHRNERPETAVRLAERAREPGLAPDRDPPGSYRGVPVELRRGGQRGAEDTIVRHHREHRTRRQPRDRRLESLEAPPDDHHAGGHRRDAENVRPPVDDGEPRGGLRRASDRPHEELTRGRYLDEWGTTRVHDQQQISDAFLRQREDPRPRALRERGPVAPSRPLDHGGVVSQ